MFHQIFKDQINHYSNQKFLLPFKSTSHTYYVTNDPCNNQSTQSVYRMFYNSNEHVIVNNTDLYKACIQNRHSNYNNSVHRTYRTFRIVIDRIYELLNMEICHIVSNVVVGFFCIFYLTYYLFC